MEEADSSVISKHIYQSIQKHVSQRSYYSHYCKNLKSHESHNIQHSSLSHQKETQNAARAKWQFLQLVTQGSSYNPIEESDDLLCLQRTNNVQGPFMEKLPQKSLFIMLHGNLCKRFTSSTKLTTRCAQTGNTSTFYIYVLQMYTPHCVANQQLKILESSDLWQWNSSHQQQKFQSGSFLQGKYETMD